MGRGRLFEGGDYFKYFSQRGAIIQGRRLIEGRLLFEEIRYPTFKLGFLGDFEDVIENVSEMVAERSETLKEAKAPPVKTTRARA